MSETQHRPGRRVNPGKVSEAVLAESVTLIPEGTADEVGPKA